MKVQLCGDAHLANFGMFASTERALVFDMNDFDETLPGPFDWDVKRLAATSPWRPQANGLKDKHAAQGRPRDRRPLPDHHGRPQRHAHAGRLVRPSRRRHAARPGCETSLRERDGQGQPQVPQEHDRLRR